MDSIAASRRRFLSYLAASPLAASPLAAPAFAQRRQNAEILTAADALNVFELETIAKRNLPPAHWGYLAGGVLDDRTVQSNRDAFARWGLRARRLIDVSRVDTSIRLFGETLPSPIVLSPVSSQRAFHAEGEAAVARAAGRGRHLQILSSLTTVPLEDVIAAHGGHVWQQIYTTNNTDIGLRIAERADKAGAGAVVLTVDLAGGMRREAMAAAARGDTRDCATCHRQTGGYDFSRKRMYDSLDLTGVLSPQSSQLTWDYVGRLRDAAKRRVLIKGVMTAEDAELAIRRGADGIVVSNHGGRAEESLVGTLDVLPEIAAAVRKRIPILIDGGVRRGTDVFKALALGAAAVCIGRPYCWGLGAFGEDGVSAALNLLNEELVSTMRQAGKVRIADIGRDALSPAPR